MRRAAPSIARDEIPFPHFGIGRKLLDGLRRGYEYVAFYALLAIFGLVSLLWSALAILLHVALPRRRGEKFGQFMNMAGSRFFVAAMEMSGLIRCDLRALDELRRDGAIVIAPNHPSLLDAILVLSRLPRVVCITKPGIWKNAFLLGAAKLAGFIHNDAPVPLVRGAAAQARAGHHLLVFPEGTRTVRPPVNGFKGGFALIAKRAGAPVQTVFVESNSAFLGKSWPFFKKPEFPLIYRMRLGRRFEISGDRRAFVAELEAYYRRELSARKPVSPFPA
ncbi:MAG TPA: lysophospholipid acyltransferase family protein [Stellaceae bacterium]|nr:lysophospholipid acyltransferase family protein [Stellaceae bacterium]